MRRSGGIVHRQIIWSQWRARHRVWPDRKIILTKTKAIIPTSTRITDNRLERLSVPSHISASQSRRHVQGDMRLQYLQTRTRAQDPDKSQDTEACSRRIIGIRGLPIYVVSVQASSVRGGRHSRYARPAPALFWLIRTAANRRKPRNPTHSTHMQPLCSSIC
jgi:hypothetical protein